MGKAWWSCDVGLKEAVESRENMGGASLIGNVDNICRDVPSNMRAEQNSSK